MPSFLPGLPCLIQCPSKRSLTQLPSRSLPAPLAGDIYHRDSNCYIEKDCNIWNVGEVAFRHANGEYGFALERAEACPGRFWFFPQLKSHMVECLRARHLMPEHGTLVYYALMQNGEIYNWTHVSSRIAEVMFTLASCLTGALLGLITFVRRAQKNAKNHLTKLWSW